jgi:hypothetical protein
LASLTAFLEPASKSIPGVTLGPEGSEGNPLFNDAALLIVHGYCTVL